ncbi:hypothetical protein Cgig2_016243 [Carnegiea gigantea]|uniref:pyridoxal kinase n=1 Tax=Carnegiea gigantea TaxID=171969 RepID=A0A9Q1Q5V3_9CARY|nr:hypothetical protein Cgig2_016243 [Carnegiea gigantea]
MHEISAKSRPEYGSALVGSTARVLGLITRVRGCSVVGAVAVVVSSVLVAGGLLCARWLLGAQLVLWLVPSWAQLIQHRLLVAKLSKVADLHASLGYLVVPVVSMLTPNQFEAELLTGLRIASEQDGREACNKLHAARPSKTIIPSLPPPIPVIDSLSEGEDGEEDDNDDGGGGGGVDE